VRRSISLGRRYKLVREEERSVEMGAARTPATSSVCSDCSLEEGDEGSRVSSEQHSVENKLGVRKTINSRRQPCARRRRKPAPSEPPQYPICRLTREARFERGASFSTPRSERDCSEVGKGKPEEEGDGK